jgi:transglutaminase-like putative cysteine protease
MTRYRIEYITEYRYDEPVSEQHNAIRVRPADTATQRCEEFRVDLAPEAPIHAYRDYFGTEVLEFNVPNLHDRLVIEVHAVAVAEEPDPQPEAGAEALADPSYAEGEDEFLLPQPDQPGDERVANLAAELPTGAPLETVLAACEMIPDRFEYRRGVTYVGSTVSDLLDHGVGVCQDFTHLALRMLRSHGIAARYVSGYLFATNGNGDGNGQVQDSVELDTHAWLEALLPLPEGGARWVGADPTNRGLAGERHLKIGHGRRYSDIPPIKGVYRGSAHSELDAEVRMTRLDA